MAKRQGAVLFLAAMLLASSSAFAAEPKKKTPKKPTPVTVPGDYGSTTPATPPPAPASPPAAEAKPAPAPAAPSAQAWSEAKSDVDSPETNYRVKRIAAEIAASAVGGGVLGLGLGLAFCGIASGGGQDACVAAGLVGFIIGELSGVFLGTYMVGHAMDGNGTLLATSLGLLIGSAVGATGGILMALSAQGRENPIAVISGIAIVLLAPVFGAVGGYELSSDTWRGKKRLALTPFLSPAGRGLGAMAGFSAAF